MVLIVLLLTPLISFALETTCGSAQEKYMVMIGFQSLKNTEGTKDTAVQSLFPHAESETGMKSQMCNRGWGVNVIHGDKKTAGEGTPVPDPVSYLFSQIDSMKSLPCNQRPKQFLVNVLAHGNALKDERAWERNEPHLASVGRDSSGNLIKLNMTQLARRMKTLNSGCPYPKVAIMDMSCGSAETLVNFANEGINDTCIMTGAPANGYASVRSTNQLNKMFSNLGEGTSIAGIYRNLVSGGEVTDIPKISGCTERKFDDSSEDSWLNMQNCQTYANNEGAQKNLKNFDAVAKYYYRENSVGCAKVGGCSRQHLGQVFRENTREYKQCGNGLSAQEVTCRLDASSKAFSATKMAFDITDAIVGKFRAAGYDKFKTLNDITGVSLSQTEQDYLRDLCTKNGADSCNGNQLTVSKALLAEHKVYVDYMRETIQSARMARLDECIKDGKPGTTACANFEL